MKTYQICYQLGSRSKSFGTLKSALKRYSDARKEARKNGDSQGIWIECDGERVDIEYLEVA